jgi:hypothetical protein
MKFEKNKAYITRGGKRAVVVSVGPIITGYYESAGGKHTRTMWTAEGRHSSIKRSSLDMIALYPAPTVARVQQQREVEEVKHDPSAAQFTVKQPADRRAVCNGFVAVFEQDGENAYPIRKTAPFHKLEQLQDWLYNKGLDQDLIRIVEVREVRLVEEGPAA